MMLEFCDRETHVHNQSNDLTILYAFSTTSARINNFPFVIYRISLFFVSLTLIVSISIPLWKVSFFFIYSTNILKFNLPLYAFIFGGFHQNPFTNEGWIWGWMLDLSDIETYSKLFDINIWNLEINCKATKRNKITTR